MSPFTLLGHIRQAISTHVVERSTGTIANASSMDVKLSGTKAGAYLLF